jgi:hypothetical protein
MQNTVHMQFLECHHTDALGLHHWISRDREARKQFPQGYARALVEAFDRYDPLEDDEDAYGQACDEAFDRARDMRGN